MDQLVLVYIPCPSLEEAQKLAQHLLRKRLIACANLTAAQSMYWDEGVITQSAETILVAKTMQSVVTNLEHEVSRVHSYDTPCIVTISVSANETYYNYVIQHVDTNSD